MDFFNFEQTQQALANANNAKSKQQEDVIDGIKSNFDDKVKKPLEGLGFPLVDEGSIGILRNVFSTAADKLGLSKETIESLGKKFDSLDPKEYLKDPKGALKKLFGDNIPEKLQSQLEDKLGSVTKRIQSAGIDTKGLPSKLQNIKDRKIPSINKPLKGATEEAEDLVKSLDKKTLKSLGDNPSLNDLREASLKRGLNKTLTLKDDLTSAQVGGRKVDIMGGRITSNEFKDKARGVTRRLRNIEDAGEQQKAKDELTTLKSTFDKSDTSLITKRANYARQNEVLDKYDKPSTTSFLGYILENSTTSPTSTTESLVSDGDKVVNDLDEFKGKGRKILNKVLETEVEEDADNPIGDLVAGVIGAGSAIAGLFSHHKLPKFAPITTIVPVNQIGA